MGERKRTAGPVERAVRRVILGPSGGRRELTDAEIRDGVEDSQETVGDSPKEDTP